MTTPLLLIVYRRLESVLLLLNELKKIKPSVLYVSANAPKNKQEKFYCDAIKSAIDTIDWECTIYKKYEAVHIPNSSVSITKGVNWFFSHVDQGIILEDDCIPSLSFFPLCTYLLEKYKNDERIFHITCTNSNYDHSNSPQLLFTSFIVPPWGWATWKRAWIKYSPEMDNWREAEELIEKKVRNFSFWENILDANTATKAAWDLQWNVDIWRNEGKIIMPSYNLITNIGFDDLATFTFNKDNILSNLPVKDFPIPDNDNIVDADNTRIEENLVTALRRLRN